MASSHCKRLLEDIKLTYATKTEESITSQKLGYRECWRIADSVLNEGKFTIPPLFNSPEVLSSGSDKAKMFAETFLRTLIWKALEGISLLFFSSRTNLKLHNISVNFCNSKYG